MPLATSLGRINRHLLATARPADGWWHARAMDPRQRTVGDAAGSRLRRPPRPPPTANMLDDATVSGSSGDTHSVSIGCFDNFARGTTLFD